MTSLIGQTVSHHKILEHLGGEVIGVGHRAEDTRLKRTVALKFLPADLTRESSAQEHGWRSINDLGYSAAGGKG